MTTRLIIITVPPPAIVEVIQRLRGQLCFAADAFAALAYPPHVTLRTGVRVPSDKMPYFMDEFSQLLQEGSSFSIRTEGLLFDRYEDGNVFKYLVAYRIAADAPLLGLHYRLLSYSRFQKGPQAPFQPHMTLAFDDLRESAWRQFKGDMSSTGAAIPAFQWTCDNVSLYLRVSKLWKPYHVFPLGGGSQKMSRTEPVSFSQMTASGHM